MEEKCPHCGAQLPRNAQFCIYCMHVLTEQRDVTPRNKRSKGLVFLGAGLCLAAVICAVLLWQKPESSVQKGKTEATQWQVLSSFEDFSLRAVYLSGKDSLTGLWDPDSLLLTHSGEDEDGDVWEIYQADVHLRDVRYQAAFCAGGIEVLTAVTGLTDETYEQGLALVECTISAVYNYRFSNLAAMLRDERAYPRSEAQEDLLFLAGLPDPEGEGAEVTALRRLQVQLDEMEGCYLFVDFRTRNQDGQRKYDVIILCTQDFGE